MSSPAPQQTFTCCGDHAEGFEFHRLFGLGQEAVTAGDLQGALTQYEAARAIACRLPLKQHLCALCGNLGSVYSRLGKHVEAAECHSTAKKIAADEDDQHSWLQAAINLANSHERAGAPQAAVDELQPALAIADALSDRQLQLVARANLGFAYQSLRVWAEAVECHSVAVSIADEMGGNEPLQLKCGIGAAEALVELGQSKQAMEFVRPAITLAVALDDSKTESIGWRLLGGCLGEIGQTARARDCFERMRDACVTSGDLAGEAEALAALAPTASLLKRHNEAIVAATDCVTILTKIKARDSQHLSRGHALLGRTLHHAGQYKQSVERLSIALACAKEAQNEPLQMEINSLMGTALNRMGDHGQALSFHREHHDLANRLGHQREVAVSLGNLGSALQCLGQAEKAVCFHEGQLEIALETEDTRVELQARKLLATAQFSLGHMELSAMQYRCIMGLAEQLNLHKEHATALAKLGKVEARMQRQVDASRTAERFHSPIAKSPPPLGNFDPGGPEVEQVPAAHIGLYVSVNAEQQGPASWPTHTDIPAIKTRPMAGSRSCSPSRMRGVKVRSPSLQRSSSNGRMRLATPPLQAPLAVQTGMGEKKTLVQTVPMPGPQPRAASRSRGLEAFGRRTQGKKFDMDQKIARPEGRSTTPVTHAELRTATHDAKLQLFKQGADKGWKDRQNYMQTQADGGANLSPVRGIQRKRCDTPTRAVLPSLTSPPSPLLDRSQSMQLASRGQDLEQSPAGAHVLKPRTITPYKKQIPSFGCGNWKMNEAF